MKNTFKVKYDIRKISSVVVGSRALSKRDYEFSGRTVTIEEEELSAGSRVEITYKKR